jgi:hypothetical protein
MILSQSPLASGNVHVVFREMMTVFRRRPFCFDEFPYPAAQARRASGRFLSEGRTAAMIADESPPSRSDIEAQSPLLKPANDNGGAAATPIDPRILIIARAIGRQIAREQLDELPAANDNRRDDQR